MEVSTKMAVFWILMMQAARTSEMLVHFYQTTWCYNPEDSHLNLHIIFDQYDRAALLS
jgi:hypothetical protein